MTLTDDKDQTEEPYCQEFHPDESSCPPSSGSLYRTVSAPMFDHPFGSCSAEGEYQRSLPKTRASSNCSPGELLAKYQAKVKDSKRTLSRLRLQKDVQLESIKFQLFLLESQLRKEQKEILSKLDQRDATIASQQQEITKLRRDNRRLMNRLKKMSEEKEYLHSSSSSAYNTTTSTCSSSDFSDASLYGTIGTRPSVESKQNLKSDLNSFSSTSSSNINSNCPSQDQSHNLSVRVTVGGMLKPSNKCKSLETVNPNVASVRAMADRVLHKPPIAEKPKVCSAGRILTSSRSNSVPTSQQQQQQSSPSRNSRQCTIVSTISRLLEEESDGGAASSGSSEPSSPEATLKPTTPRVIRLARKYEGVIKSDRTKQSKKTSDSSPESLRSHERVIKSLLMDDYELQVTSGYNSDAISDHDYENIRLSSSDCRSTNQMAEEEEGYVEDDDNYVVLEAMRRDDDQQANAIQEVSESEEQPLYSNVHFNSLLSQPLHQSPNRVRSSSSLAKREQQPLPMRAVGRAKSLDDLLETNLDSSMHLPGSVPNSPSKRESSQKRNEVRNLPRSRQSISHLIVEPSQVPNHMADNFEEFTLDSLELDEDEDSNEDAGQVWGLKGKKDKENLVPSVEMRRCGDGAEMKSDSNSGSKSGNFSGTDSSSTSASYEKFLEATGLSQKSILTPSRFFSNHRSVLKPRDVKHRDKLRSAFTTLATLEEAPSPTPGQNTSKYWTEPYV